MAWAPVQQSVTNEREKISEGENMSQQRGISRVVNVPPPAPGFVGPPASAMAYLTQEQALDCSGFSSY
jgi:hypothetical protein